MNKLPEKYKKYEGHTPPPWKCNGDIDDDHVFTSDGEWVCQLWGKTEENFRGDDETATNAELIADAPMLLEQLITKESQLNEAVELLRLVRGNHYTEDPLLREIDDFLNSIGGSDES
jgi:hypothetical protein